MQSFKFLAVMIVTLMTAYYANAQFVNVESNNGHTTAIDINNIESIVFEDNNLVVNNTNCGINCFNISYSEKLILGISLGQDDVQPQTNDIAVYPNPVSNTLFVNTAYNNNANVRIFNSHGSLLKTFKMTSQKCEVDVSDLPSGLYFIFINNHTSKFIKL